jgi:hypothetical protein
MAYSKALVTLLFGCQPPRHTFPRGLRKDDEERAMKLLMTKRRRSRQSRMFRSPLALTLLLSFGVHVSAQCPLNTTTSNHGSIGAHMLEISCSRESSSRINSLPRPPIEGHVEGHADPVIANRWSMAASVSAANVVSQAKESDLESPVARSLGELRWTDSHDWINNPPEWVKAARNYKRQGMPIIHLMQSKDTLVALGVSNHGKPGLYFTRKVGF